MKKTYSYVLSLFLLQSIAASGNDLVIYEAPPGAEAANDYELIVNGRKVFVYTVCGRY